MLLGESYLMKVKILIFSIIIAVVFGFFPLYSLPSNLHNQQIGDAIFRIATWAEMSRKSDSVKIKYYIATNAASIAIDGKLNAYSNLIENVSKLNPSIADKLPDLKDLKQLSGGSHRFYNHQGYYNDYGLDVNRTKIWVTNRDNILRPSVAAIYGIHENSGLTDIFSSQIYYTHLFGDLQEGKIRSINQMTGSSYNGIKYDLRTPAGIITAYTSDGSMSSSKLSTKQQLIQRKYDVDFESLKRKYANYKFDGDLKKLRKFSRAAQLEFNEITNQLNLELLDLERVKPRTDRLKGALKSSAIGGLEGAGLGITISVLTEGFSKGFDNISWQNTVNTAGVMGFAGVVYPIAKKSTSSLVKGVFGAKPLTAMKVASGVPVCLDLFVDIGSSFYFWKSGQISGKRALRQATMLVVSDLATEAIIAVPSLIASAAATGGAAGTILGPFGTAVGVGVGVSVSLASYFIINPLIDKLLSSWDTKDILNEIKTEKGIVKVWTAEYFEQPLYY